jgi:malate dehydrogenase
MRQELTPAVQNRGAAVIAARKLSSALSAAQAIANHVRDWVLGTPEGEFVSMGVHSGGNPYGVPDDLVFSFPVTCKAGEWRLVPGLALPPRLADRLGRTVEELMEEKAAAFSQSHL